MASSEPSDNDDLAFSIEQLCLLVDDIKEGFHKTIKQLSQFQSDDSELKTKVEHTITEYAEKFQEVEKSIHHLKEQLGGVAEKIHDLENNHRSLQLQLNHVQRSQSFSEELFRQHFLHNHAALRNRPESASYARSACTTPMSAFCPPMSPDSGRPGTSPDLHSFLATRAAATADEPSVISSAAVSSDNRLGHALMTFKNSSNNCDSLKEDEGAEETTNGGHSSEPCESSESSESMTAEANKSLDLSKALAERYLHNADSSDEDCELDKESDESLSTAREQNGEVTESNGIAEDDDDFDILPATTMNGGRLHLHSSPAKARFMRRPAPHEKLFRETQRKKVCEEIIETERKYCSCLWTIIDLIAETLKSSSFVSIKDLCLIFPRCLPRLYKLHSVFLCLLEEKFNSSTNNSQNATSMTYSGIILDLLEVNSNEFFDLYRSYVNDFTTAIETVHKYMHHSGKFRKLVQTLQHHPNCEGLDLTAFLLTPVQRVPRYLLLMKQLSSYTDDDHPDFESLELVLCKLHALLEELNYSIQNALQKASQSGKWKKPSLPRRLKISANQSSSCESLARGNSEIIIYEGESILSGTSQQQAASRSMNILNRIMRKQASCDGESLLIDDHFLNCRLSGGRRGTLPELSLIHPSSFPGVSTPKLTKRYGRSPAYQRCRSVPPKTDLSVPQGSPSRGGTPVKAQLATPDSSPDVRSRNIARRLRHTDRSLSAGDILRSRRQTSPDLIESLPVRERHDPSLQATAYRWTTTKVMPRRQKTPPRPSLKESFRKMFLPKKKLRSQDSQDDATFEDENGEPCTNV